MLRTRAWPPTGLIPWFSKTEGNTYATLMHHPFLFKGKPTQCLRGRKKDFWRHCRGGSRKTSQDLAPDNESLVARLQVQTYQVPSQPLSPELHYLPFASRFPLPNFTLAVLFALSLYPPSLSLFASFCPFLVCLCVGLLACHDGSR